MANDEKGRITVRIPEHLIKVLEDAANLCNMSLNQFVVQAALEKVDERIDNLEKIVLTVKDSRFFFNLIDNPPPSNEKLMEAFARYNKRKEVDKEGNVGFKF